jgi:hypothetical protein
MGLDPIDRELPKRPPQPCTNPGMLDLTPEQWGTEGVFVARFRYQHPSS